MIEDAIEDNSKALPVRHCNKLEEDLVRPGPFPGCRILVDFSRELGAITRVSELVIDVPVVCGVVLVDARRLENRIQIKGGDAEAAQIGEFSLDALKIAAIVPVARPCIASASSRCRTWRGS